MFHPQPIHKLFQVKIVLQEDLLQVKMLFDACLGENYLRYRYLQEFMQKPGAVCIATEVDDALAGAVIAHRLAHPSEILSLLNPEYTWGLLKTIAVHPKYRELGIGSTLTQEAMHLLQNDGCEQFVVEAWKSSSPQNSLHMLERLGFEKLSEIPNYWSKIHGAEMPCIECGQNCKCTAIIMVRASQQ